MAENNNAEREGRILDAAADLIAHYGYDKTTMDDIARAAGVSKGAIYLHFKGKDEMLDALMLREGEALAQKIIAQVEADPNGATIFNIYRYSLTAVAEHPLLRAMYSQDRRVLGDYLRRLKASSMYAQGLEFGVDFVKHFQAAGLLRQDIRPEVIAYLLIVVRYGLLTVDDIVDNAAAPPLEEVGMAMALMLEQGLAQRGGDSEAGKAALRALMEFGLQAMKERQTRS